MDDMTIAVAVVVVAVCLLLGITIRGCQDYNLEVLKACLEKNPAWQCERLQQK